MTYQHPSSPEWFPAAQTPLSTPRRGLGLPLLAIIGLALLAVPRIVTHDLGLAAPGSVANTLLAVTPLIVWVVVALLWSRRPLLSLLVAGAFYGVALAVVHNLTWGVVFGDSRPRLGGNLAGVLTPAVEEILMRSATVVSGLATGIVTGVICGLIAWGVQAIARAAGARLPLTAWRSSTPG